MRKTGFYKSIFVLLALSGCQRLAAQNALFLADGIDDYIRRSQLTGRLDIQQSLTNRSFASNYRMLDTLLPEWAGTQRSKTNTSPVNFHWLPAGAVLQTNTHHPFGSNDGGLIPAKGFETAITAGFTASMGNFSVQLKPEFVFAPNPTFPTFPIEQNEPYWVQYYRWLNTTDMPERFGNSSYNKFFPGQSFLRYNTGPVSIGISTESMWWGPGVKNALVMSNNAPGFLHGSVRTEKPIPTGIGSFEGEIIGGGLTASGIIPVESNMYNSANNQRLYQPKRDESRYIAGMVLSWQPKWVKGLYIGFAKTSYLYQSDISGIADIFPLEGIITSSSEKDHHKASLGSLFARYAMPEEKAELYIEYGRNDKSPNLVNIVADNGYPHAFVAGFRKLFSTRKENSYIEFLTEFTQLSLPTTDLVFSGRSWYTDSSVRHGYTHYGQSLGSGLGPGSNSQMIDISWIKGYNKVGLMFERVLHNNDFYYNAFVIVDDYTRKWVDISTTLHIDWNLRKKFLLSSQLALSRSINYEWMTFPGMQYFSNGYDVLNFYGRLSVAYRL